MDALYCTPTATVQWNRVQRTQNRCSESVVSRLKTNTDLVDFWPIPVGSAYKKHFSVKNMLHVRDELCIQKIFERIQLQQTLQIRSPDPVFAAQCYA